jgi:hypothetical protein
MKLQYPNFLNDQPETETKRVWLSHIGDYTPEAIEKAAVLAPDRFPRFPPTIGEFKLLLKEVNTPKPETTISLSPVCPHCHADRRTQYHADRCGA